MDVPQGIDSKFRFILISAKRARQLQAGAKPLIQVQGKKLTKVAQHEVTAGLVPFEILATGSENGDQERRSRTGK